MYSLNETKKKKKLHQSIIIAIALTSIVVYCEFNGVHEIAEKATVDTSKLDNLNSTLANYNSELLKVATSKRWQDIESKRAIQKAIEAVNIQLEKEEKIVKEQTLEAEEKSQSFRFFSVIMLVLSCIASSCVDSNSTNVKEAVLSGIEGVKSGINTVLSESSEKSPKTASIGFKSNYINTPINTPINTDEAKRRAYLEKYENVVLELKKGNSINQIVLSCNVSKSTIQNVKRCLNNQ
jgi:hypothetical protein